MCAIGDGRCEREKDKVGRIGEFGKSGTWNPEIGMRIEKGGGVVNGSREERSAKMRRNRRVSQNWEERLKETTEEQSESGRERDRKRDRERIKERSRDQEN